MKVIFIGLVITAISVNAWAHGKETDCDLSSLNGDWNVFYPDGAQLDGQVEQESRLHIVIGDIKKYSAVLGGSVWEVIGPIEGTCREVGNVPTLAIKIQRKLDDDGHKESWLCVDRVTTLMGLMKRKNQREPKLRQVGTSITDNMDACLLVGPSAAGVTPGHAHADD